MIYSLCKCRIVRGPNHDPCVEIEQGTARSWSALTITYAQGIARILATVHAPGNGAIVPGWNQRQFTQNVGKRNNINHRIRGWQVHELRSNVGSAGPPRFSLTRAIIVQGLDKRTLALLRATSVGADPHLKNQITSTDQWTDCTRLKTPDSEAWGGQKNEVLPARKQKSY